MESEAATEDLLRILSKVADDYAVFALDTGGRIVRWPPEAQRLKGFAPEEVLGEHVSVFYEPTDVEEGKPQRALVIASDQGRYEEEGWRRRKDGSRFWASVIVTPLRDAEGRLVGYAKVTRDLSRQRLEAIRQGLEARWHRMADALPILFSFVGTDERHRFVNKAYEDWFGIPRSEIVGKSVRELLGEDTYRSVEHHVRAALSGENVRYEAELRTPGVEPRSTEVFHEPELAEDGSVAGFYVVVLDVTARKGIERALRRREAAIRALHQIGSHPSLDLDEKIRALLELGCEQLHLDLGVLARVADGRWEVRQTHPKVDGVRRGDVFPLARTLCAETLRAPEPQGFVDPTESDSGEYPAYPGERVEAYLGVPVSVAGEVYGTLSFASLRCRSEPFTEADRDLIRLMSLWIGNELHRRRVLETQTMLAEAGRVLASSLKDDEVLDIIVHLAVPTLGDGCVLYTVDESGAVRRAAGAHADAELNAVVQESIGSTLGPMDDRQVLEVVRGGAPLLLPLTGERVTSASTRSDHGLNGFPLRAVRSMMVLPLTVRGQVSGAMALVSAQPHRYTETGLASAQELALRGAMALDNARLYRRARDAILMRDDVLSFVTHDLGSPLSSISMVVDRLLDVPDAEDRRRRTRSYLEGVRDSANRMERLIHDLLEVRQLEEGRLAVRRRKVSAAVLLDTVLREFRPRCEESSVAVEIASVGPVAVRADRDRLLQVLSNLMDNAVKFTDAGGTIRLRVESRKDDVLFSVSDTGVGIDEERLASLFDRYAQARRTRRAGAGLGLAIAKEIIEAHGGAIWAESTVGVGSTFYFTLPKA